MHVKWLAMQSFLHGVSVALEAPCESFIPPLSTRSMGLISVICSPMGAWGSGRLTSTEYLQQANDGILTILQIETKEALDNVEEIAAVDGVDVLFVGPFDLGNSIGAYPSYIVDLCMD